MSQTLAHVRGLHRAVGSVATARILGRRLLRNRAPVTATVVRGPSAGSAITLRPLDSDLFVASQIFGWEDYRLNGVVATALQALAKSWVGEGLTPVIIDGGANVGYSTIYFARAYPEATVLAIEPDPETFRALEENTAGLANVHCVHGALWRDDHGVNLQQAGQGSWATNTVAAAAAEQRTPSMTLAQLAERVINSRILILKLDIEGAERQACDACPEAVSSASCVIVEPHDFLSRGAASMSPIYKILADKEVDTYVQGENLIFVDSAVLRSPS